MSNLKLKENEMSYFWIFFVGMPIAMLVLAGLSMYWEYQAEKNKRNKD